MMKRLILIFAVSMATAYPLAAQKGGHRAHRSSAGVVHAPKATTPRASHAPGAKSSRSLAPRAPRVKAAPTPGARDSRGRLERSSKAKDDFMRSSGHPKGWPGHVVDHIVPLACGGSDSPSNMQWQTTTEAKAKDKVERKGCKR